MVTPFNSHQTSQSCFHWMITTPTFGGVAASSLNSNIWFVRSIRARSHLAFAVALKQVTSQMGTEPIPVTLLVKSRCNLF